MFDSTSQIADQTVGLSLSPPSTGHVPLQILLVPATHEFLLHVCRLETPPDPPVSKVGFPFPFISRMNPIVYDMSRAPVPLISSEGQRGLISGYQGIGGVL